MPTTPPAPPPSKALAPSTCKTHAAAIGAAVAQRGSPRAACNGAAKGPDACGGAEFDALTACFPLPPPTMTATGMRRDTPPKAPGAGKPHARMCDSEAEWLSYSTTGRRSPQAPSGHRAIAYGRSRRPGGHRRPAGPAARRAGPRAASWRPCVRPPRHRPPDRRTRRRPVHDGRRVHGSIGDRADQQCAAGAATPGPAPAAALANATAIEFGTAAGSNTAPGRHRGRWFATTALQGDHRQPSRPRALPRPVGCRAGAATTLGRRTTAAAR